MEEIGSRTLLKLRADKLCSSMKVSCTEVAKSSFPCLEMSLKPSPSLQQGPKQKPSLPKEPLPSQQPVAFVAPAVV